MNIAHVVRAIEYARLGMHVPDALTKEIISKLKLKKDSTILVMFSYEMLATLHGMGYTNVYLMFDNPRESIKNIVKYFGYKIVTDEELYGMRRMKFNVGLGNPPFSVPNKKTGRGGTRSLYPDFYARAVDCCESVAMIMPSTHNRVAKEHNDKLRETANQIHHIDPKLFPTVARDMWYVISDGSNSKPDVDWLFDGENNNTLELAKGKLHVTADKALLTRDTKNENDVTVYHKVTGKTGLVTKYCEQHKVGLGKRFPNTGYAVLMPQQLTKKGWPATFIVKCDGNQAAMNGMNIAFLENKKEAQRLDAYMKTPDFINSALKYVGGMGNMTLAAMKRVNMAKFENNG